MGFPHLLHDLRYTFRTLRRDAGFAVFAILIAGLGIGASMTVFAVVNTLLLAAAPLREVLRAGGLEHYRRSSTATAGFLPSAEDAQFTTRYVIREGKNFLGRLHVQMQSAYRPEDQECRARGKPIGAGIGKGTGGINSDIGLHWFAGV